MSLTKVSYSMIKGASVNVLDFIPADQVVFIQANDAASQDGSVVTAAIQAAIDHAYAFGNPSAAYQGQPYVYLPSGTYKITDSLVLKDGASIRGEGPRNTFIVANLANKSAIRTQWGESPLYAQRTYIWDLRDFEITGDNAVNSIGINMGSVGYSRIKDVRVIKMDRCIYTSNNGYYNTWDCVDLQGNTCMHLESDGGANTIINPHMSFVVKGIELPAGDFVLIGGSIEGPDPTGAAHYCLLVGKGTDDGTTASLKCVGTYFETYEVVGELGYYATTMYQCTLTNISKRGFASALTVAVPDQLYIQAFLGKYTAVQNVMRVDFGASVSGPKSASLTSPSGSLLQVRNLIDTADGYLQASNTWLSGAPINPGVGVVALGGTTASTVGAAGGASALPATPLGYLNINVGGVAAKIPYYTA